MITLAVAEYRAVQPRAAAYLIQIKAMTGINQNAPDRLGKGGVAKY
jgi:hypothetical protein